MIGLSILIVLIVYIVIARLVLKRVNNRPLKYLLITVFIMIPLGDHLLGRLYLTYKCNTDGGLKIYDTVEKVEGFLAMAGTQSADLYYFKNLKYRYLEKTKVDEHGDANKNLLYVKTSEENQNTDYEDEIAKYLYIFEYTIDKKPLGFIEQKYSIKKTTSPKSETVDNIFYYTIGQDNQIIRTEKNTSQSKYIVVNTRKKKPFGFIEQQYRIEEIISGKLMAKATNLTFNGGWIIEGLHLTGEAVRCPENILFPSKFLNDVLKPVLNAR